MDAATEKLASPAPLCAALKPKPKINSSRLALANDDTDDQPLRLVPAGPAISILSPLSVPTLS